MTSPARHAFEEHTGELRMSLSAPTLEELFAEAARALAEATLGDRPLPVGEGEPERVAVEGRDREALLVAFLDELVFRMETSGRVYPEVQVERVGARAMTATIRGAPVADLRPLVKAATYHDLSIRGGNDGFSCTVVLDV